MITKAEMGIRASNIFADCLNVFNAGQREYTNGESAFGNFERLAAELDISREKILWIFATKHRDGISSYLNGHKSQREPITGRIKDLIVYLTLLHAMVEDE